MSSYVEVTQRAWHLWVMTGLIQSEFITLFPHFENALLTYMQEHTIDRQPRPSRRYSTYDTSFLLMIADKLFFSSNISQIESHPKSVRITL